MSSAEQKLRRWSDGIGEENSEVKVLRILDEIRVDLQEHRKLSEQKHNEIVELIANNHRTVMRGFPKDNDGNHDPDSHREYHETLIERNKKMTEFWSNMLFELGKWGLIGFIGWLAISGWHEIVAIIKDTK